MNQISGLSDTVGGIEPRVTLCGMNQAFNKFSLFRGAKDPTPAGQINLVQMAVMIRGDELVTTIVAIRAAKLTGDAETASRLKQGLPAVTISGTFSEREKGGLLEHSGLLVLDFDNMAPESLPDLKTRLAADSHVQAMFVSPSGNGLKVVVRIPAEPAKHRASFLTAATYFKTSHGIDADASGKDVTRLCFLSYDPDAFLRDGDAEVFVPVAEAPKPNRTVAQTPPNPQEIRSALDALDPDCDYDGWLRIGMSIHSALQGEDGLQIWDEWSSRAAKYKPGDCSSRWSGFTVGTITIATLFGLAREAGWRPEDATEKPTVILPSGESTITACASVLGKLLSDQRLLFNRGGTLAKVVLNADGEIVHGLYSRS